jgi:hypothetical protein
MCDQHYTTRFFFSASENSSKFQTLHPILFIPNRQMQSRAEKRSLAPAVTTSQLGPVELRKSLKKLARRGLKSSMKSSRKSKKPRALAPQNFNAPPKPIEVIDVHQALFQIRSTLSKPACLANLCIVHKFKNLEKAKTLSDEDKDLVNSVYQKLIDWFAVDLSLHGLDFRSPELRLALRQEKFSGMDLPAGTTYSACLFREARVWDSLKSNPRVLDAILRRFEKCKIVDSVSSEYKPVFPAHVQLCDVIRQLSGQDVRFHVHYKNALEALAWAPLGDKECLGLCRHKRVMNDFLDGILADGLILPKQPSQVFYLLVSQHSVPTLKKMLTQLHPPVSALPIVPEFLAILESMDGIEGLYEACFEEVAKTFSLADVPAWSRYPALCSALCNRAAKEQKKRDFYEWWFKASGDLKKAGLTSEMKSIIFKSAGVKNEADGNRFRPSRASESTPASSTSSVSSPTRLPTKLSLAKPYVPSLPDIHKLPSPPTILEQASSRVVKAIRSAPLGDGHPFRQAFARLQKYVLQILLDTFYHHAESFYSFEIKRFQFPFVFESKKARGP